MKKAFVKIISLLLVTHALAQKEKFDIATFTAPRNWQRVDSNGITAFFDAKAVKEGTVFCQIFLYPSQPTSGNAASDFQTEWNNHVVKPTGFTGKPTTELGKADGWEVTTGYSNITHGGITFTCMLVTATGFGREMSVLVNVAGPDYMSEVQKFLTDFDLDGEAAAALNKSKNTTSPMDVKNTVAKSSASLSNYHFTTPQDWYIQNNNDYILLSQTQSPTYGCTLTILPSQPSSGDLEKDARNIFNQMYPGWQYRNTNENKEDVSKGYNVQGLEYCMIEAKMQKPRPDGYYYDYEDGQVLVINLGNQIAVIAGRHERGEFTCFCKYRYDFWNRFFNSFIVDNVSSQKPAEDVSKRIVGSWQSMGGSALTKYIFAANRRYQFIGAYSTTSRVSWNTIELKTSGFTGDGAYSIKDNKLTTIRDSDKKADAVQYRLERVNHGGTGWRDRLYMLANSVDDGKPYEVCYEKEVKE